MYRKRKYDLVMTYKFIIGMVHRPLQEFVSILSLFSTQWVTSGKSKFPEQKAIQDRRCSLVDQWLNLTD